MKLYSEDNSPYCAPVRAAIYAKGLEIPIESPPGGLKSEGYRAISLTGTIPCLILEDGSPLPESSVIIDYLDDKFPPRPLTPANPEARARMKVVQRIAEADLVGPMVQLYHDLAAGDGEAGKVRTLARFERGLALIEALIADEAYVAGPELSTADCIFAPALLGVGFWSAGLGRPGLLADHPRIAAYTARAHAHPAIARVLGELRAALAKSPISAG
jgi:glutathione S-transferase